MLAVQSLNSYFFTSKRKIRKNLAKQELIFFGVLY